MTAYLITFPSTAMDLSGTDLAAVSADTHEVVAQAKAAGVWVFGGGLDASVAPVTVARDGAVTDGGYPETARLTGGWTVLDVPNREAALDWAARLAAACRCPQEVRAFMDDPES